MFKEKFGILFPLVFILVIGTFVAVKLVKRIDFAALKESMTWERTEQVSDSDTSLADTTDLSQSDAEENIEEYHTDESETDVEETEVYTDNTAEDVEEYVDEEEDDEEKQEVVEEDKGNENLVEFGLEPKSTDDEISKKYVEIIKKSQWIKASQLLLANGRVIDIPTNELLELVFEYGDKEEFCKLVLVNHDYSEDNLNKGDLVESYAKEVYERTSKFESYRIKH